MFTLRTAWPASLVWATSAYLGVLLFDTRLHEFLQWLVPLLLTGAVVLVVLGAADRAQRPSPVDMSGAAVGLGLITMLASGIVWGLSRWPTLKPWATTPGWLDGASLGVQVYACLLSWMLLSSLAVGASRALAGSRPSLLLSASCHAVAAAVGVLLLSWYVVMPDPTSADLLAVTFPVALVLLVLAGGAATVRWWVRAKMFG